MSRPQCPAPTQLRTSFPRHCPGCGRGGALRPLYRQLDSCQPGPQVCQQLLGRQLPGPPLPSGLQRLQVQQAGSPVLHPRDRWAGLPDGLYSQGDRSRGGGLVVSEPGRRTATWGSVDWIDAEPRGLPKACGNEVGEKPHSPLPQACSVGSEGAGALEPSERSPHDLPQ